MKKIFSLIFCVLLISGTASCTKRETACCVNTMKKMLSAAKDLPKMSQVSSEDENAADLFTYLSDMDYKKIDSFAFTYSASGTAEALAVITVRDSADLKEAENSLGAYKKQRIATFRTYNAEQVAIAQKTVVFSRGNSAFLITCKNPEDVKKEIE